MGSGNAGPGSGDDGCHPILQLRRRARGRRGPLRLDPGWIPVRCPGRFCLWSQVFPAHWPGLLTLATIGAVSLGPLPGALG